MDLREKFFDGAVIDDLAAKNILRADSLEMMKSEIPNKPDLRIRLNLYFGSILMLISLEYGLFKK